MIVTNYENIYTFEISSNGMLLARKVLLSITINSTALLSTAKEIFLAIISISTAID